MKSVQPITRRGISDIDSSYQKTMDYDQNEGQFDTHSVLYELPRALGLLSR